MPFQSKAQQRFMFAKYPEMAKEWADKTPDISKLPEHVKNMADGGEVFNPPKGDFDAIKASMAGSGEQLEPGVYDDTDPGHINSIVNSLGSGMAAGSMAEIPSLLKNLGEAGEFSLGKAPEMEGMGPKIEVFSKGKMGAGTPHEMTIWGVKGAPEEIAKLGYGNDPASIPEHVLQQHGLLPDMKIDATDQSAPNGYAQGGEVKVNDPKTGLSASTYPIQMADGGDFDPVSMLAQAAPAAAAPTDVENGAVFPAQQAPVDQDFINKLNAGTAITPSVAPSPISQASQAAQSLPPTNPSIYQGISADDRAALMQKLMAQKASPGNLAISGIAGLGDAISNAFGKGGQNTQGQIRQNRQQNTEQQVGAVDTQRAQRTQDLQANLAQQENDPASPYSSGMRQFYSQLTGKQFPSGISASMMKSAFPDYAKIFDSQLTAATAQRGQTLGAQEKIATKSPWSRLVDSIVGNPAEEKLASETGVSSPSDNGGWSVKR